MQKDYVPFRDAQQAPAIGYCPVCGRERYARDGLCLYCQRYGNDPQRD